MVSQILREHQLYVKLSKCSFYQKQIHYLGHIISKEGIAVDPEKIKAIEIWPTPRNVSEVISFMGLSSYYRRFIEEFSNISHPITSLQRKGVKFEWTWDREGSFQHLKHLLRSDPILLLWALAFLRSPPICIVGRLGGPVSCGVVDDKVSCVVVSPLPCSSYVGALSFFHVYPSFFGALPFLFDVVF
jgi:hypothetical protein